MSVGDWFGLGALFSLKQNGENTNRLVQHVGMSAPNQRGANLSVQTDQLRKANVFATGETAGNEERPSGAAWRQKTGRRRTEGTVFCSNPELTPTQDPQTPFKLAAAMGETTSERCRKKERETARAQRRQRRGGTGDAGRGEQYMRPATAAFTMTA